MAGDDAAKAVFDSAAFERQTGGDAGLRAEVVQMFLEDCPVRVEEIRAAVMNEDAPALVSCAHALKGSAAYLSASIVRGCAADLERAGREGRVSDGASLLAALDAAVADLIAALQNLS